MRKMKFLAPLLIITTVIGSLACRKLDKIIEKEDVKKEAAFWETYKSNDESILAVINFMKRDDAKYHFADKMMTEIGLPR